MNDETPDPQDVPTTHETKQPEDASVSDAPRRPFVRSPLATALEIAGEDPAYPATTGAKRDESLFADWRKRLTRNLARRSDGRWDPLTFVHDKRTDATGEPGEPGEPGGPGE